MSFEDLQQKWRNQFAESSRGADSQIEIELLDRIRRSERQFRHVVILLSLRDLVSFSLIVWILGKILDPSGQHLFLPLDREHRAILVVGIGLMIAISLAVIRYSFPRTRVTTSTATIAAIKSSLHRTRATPSTAEGGTDLPERFRSHVSRFDTMILWRDLRLLARAIFLISVAVMLAWRAQHYSAYVWMAVVLFTTATVSFLTYRLRTRAQRPPVDDTLLGTLTLSIYETRRQVQLLDNLWWYIAPLFLGLLLLGPVLLVVVGGGVRLKPIVGGLALVTLGWIVWRVSRWSARHELRPRLEHLEKLKSELSNDASSNQP